MKATMCQDAVSTSLRDPAARHTPEWTLHWFFRLALCAEFVGHGAFGVMTKQAWVPYFTLFGFPEAWAWQLIPVVGSIDYHLRPPGAHRPDACRAPVYGLLGVLYGAAPTPRGGRGVGVSGTVL